MKAPGGNEKSSLGSPAYSTIIFTILYFFFLGFFKGDADTSQAIWKSLSPTAIALSNSHEPAGGISAIGWSLVQGLNLSIKAIQSGLATYYIFSILLVYLTVGFIVADQRSISICEFYKSKELLLPFIAVVLTFLPLFALGWDWGRWVMGIWNISIFIYLLQLDAKVAQLIESSIDMRFLKFRIIIFPVLLCLGFITRVPECCFGGSGTSLFSNPAFSSLRSYVKNILFGL
jgi:hypothetical protein